MALYSNKLFVGRSDLHVVALDMKTGNIVWDQPLANPADGWNLTGGPLVAKGKVMQGIGGRGKGGAYIAGLDSETLVVRPEASPLPTLDSTRLLARAALKMGCQ